MLTLPHGPPLASNRFRVPPRLHLPIASWFARRVRATDKHGQVVLLKLKESAVLLPVYIGEFECTSLVKEINKKPTVGAYQAAGGGQQLGFTELLLRLSAPKVSNAASHAVHCSAASADRP